MAYKKSEKQVVKTPATKKKKPGRPKKPKTKKPKSQHYVNGKEFLQKIKDYYDTDVLGDEVCEMVVKIANGLSYAPNFINYSYFV